MVLRVERSREPAHIQWVPLITAIAIPLVVGFFGSLATVHAIPTWYLALHKPFFNPPNWLFGPVWTLLYVAMGVSSYLIYVKCGFRPKGQSYFTTYILQLVLNLGWSVVFFGLHDTKLAVLVILALWYFIWVLIEKAGKLSRHATYLLYPYLAWVSFATLLNIAVAFMN